MGILGDKLSYLPGEGVSMGQEPIYERRGDIVIRQQQFRPLPPELRQVRERLKIFERVVPEKIF